MLDGIIIALLAVIGYLVVVRGRWEFEKAVLHRLDLIIHLLRPRLSRIQIAIIGGKMADPITLQVGDTRVAAIQGFDQSGGTIAIDFSANPGQWSVDNPAVLAISPAGDGSTCGLQAAASGVAVLSAVCAGFSDSLSATVQEQAKQLSSIKIVVS